MTRHRVLQVIAVLAVSGGLALSAYAVFASRRVSPPTPQAGDARATAAVATGASSPKVVPSPPVRITIPSIGVASVLGPPRGLTPQGTIDDAPLSGPIWSLPWWYDRGRIPGEPGSAVILGHVDSASGAGHLGVFFRLGDLRPGALVTVTLADGTVTRWTVESVDMYPDTGFPDSVVYDPSGPPRLRLVTCGGAFD